MRLYRPPVIGPRAAGVSLLVLGVTAFVLLGLFSPRPAEARTTSSIAVESVRCEERALRDAGQASSDKGAINISCDSATGVQQGGTGSMVVQEIGEAPLRKVFLSLALATLGGAILFEGRLRPGCHCVLPVSSRRQRT